MYLGLIIFYNGIKINPKKVAAIINWESPIIIDLKILVVLVIKLLKQDLNRLVNGIKPVEL
jgi:hypothetical protein